VACPTPRACRRAKAAAGGGLSVALARLMNLISQRFRLILRSTVALALATGACLGRAEPSTKEPLEAGAIDDGGAGIDAVDDAACTAARVADAGACGSASIPLTGNCGSSEAFSALKCAELCGGPVDSCRLDNPRCTNTSCAYDVFCMRACPDDAGR